MTDPSHPRCACRLVEVRTQCGALIEQLQKSALETDSIVRGQRAEHKKQLLAANERATAMEASYAELVQVGSYTL